MAASELKKQKSREKKIFFYSLKNNFVWLKSKIVLPPSPANTCFLFFSCWNRQILSIIIQVFEPHGDTGYGTKIFVRDLVSLYYTECSKKHGNSLTTLILWFSIANEKRVSSAMFVGIVRKLSYTNRVNSSLFIVCRDIIDASLHSFTVKTRHNNIIAFFEIRYS